MTNLDVMWRGFFIGEKHQTLSQMVAYVFNMFIKKCLKTKIVLENDFNKRLLVRVDQSDLSTTSKLADTFFETRFINRNNVNIKCNLGSALRKYYNESLVSLDTKDLENLKVDIHKFSQFESLSKIFLISRNINAHWQIPVNDIGHGSLVAGSILRFIELFDFPDFTEEKIEKIRTLALKIILQVSNIENETDEIRDDLPSAVEMNNLETSNTLQNNINENSRDASNYDITHVGSENNEIIEENNEFPDINFDQENTYEQKRQLLMGLSYEMLKDPNISILNLNRRDCILSRSCIKEYLTIQNMNIEKFKNCSSIIYLNNENEDAVKKQIDLYFNKILNILN